MKLLTALTLAAALPAALSAAPRTVIDLNDGWTADGVSVTQPPTWNAVDGADGLPDGAKDETFFDWRTNSAISEGGYARKAVAYRRNLPSPRPGRRFFFRCKGASVTAEVFVNGVLVGRHLGAYTAFCYEITEQLREKDNQLLVIVDNRRNRDLPTLSADFTVFGGLYRGCELIETDSVCIDPTFHGGSGVALSPDPATGHVTAWVRVLGAPDERREYDFPDFELWSPENPKLYTLTVTLANGDAVTETFGFRTVKFDEDGSFVLNGKARRLRGVNRHQDRQGKGWAVSAADEAEDVALIKEIGADAVRTAHYPQSENFYDLLDREGLIAWCEVPVTDAFSPTPAYQANVDAMILEMVAQLGNHPSISMWSIFNEVQNYLVPNVPDKTAVALLERERSMFKALDQTRPIVAATCEFDKLAINAVPEALAINTYPGWYVETADKTAAIVESACVKNSRRKLGVSEYGAGGNPAQHEWPAKGVRCGGPFHPQELQAVLHATQFGQMKSNERVWGTFVWNMFDFGADARDEGSTPGLNDKGLVTYDRKTKKDAFYLYQANWSQRPVLHLVGATLTELKETCVPVLAFANVGPVTLKVNGEVVATRESDETACVRFDSVRLKAGANQLELSGGGQTASAIWTVTP